MANGIVQFTTDIINDSQKTTKTTYSSDKIEQLLANIPAGKGSEVILGCFATPPTTFVQDDQYYNTTDGKVYKATSSTAWDSGNTPIEDTLYASIDDSKIYAYIKGNWGIYGGNTTNISAKSNNIVENLQGQTNANEDGLYVPLSQKSGNVIDNLTGQTTDVNNGLFVGRSAKADNALQKLTGNTNPSEDGLYVEDLNSKINKINATTRLNEVGATDYLYLRYSKVDTTSTTPVSVNSSDSVMKYFDIIETNITDNSYDSTTGIITLKAGITYELEACLLDNVGNMNYWFLDKTNNKMISNKGLVSIGSPNNDTSLIKSIITPKTDIEVSLKISKNVNMYLQNSYVSIVAVNSLTIDPLQYVDNTNGTQDTPVGTIINIMGNNAPKHYLKCDGSEYQIKDYPYLAEYFKKEFGSANKFGGDGTVTFKTPDLRGEFLRNTGINSHTNQGNGATVGTHQDATELAMIQNWNDVTIAIDTGLSGWQSLTKADSTIKTNKRSYRDVGIQTTSNQGQYITTRPTNTSVLYCIKAEPTYFINVIGTTIEKDLISTPLEYTKDTAIMQSVNIEDFSDCDKLEFILEVKNNGKWMYQDTKTFRLSEITFNTSSNYDEGTLALKCCDYLGIMLNIVNNSELFVLHCNDYINITAMTDIRIKKIKGIKTTSAVQGGSFGGGSSNPDCDCGKLTDAQIAIAISETKTKWDT